MEAWPKVDHILYQKPIVSAALSIALFKPAFILVYTLTPSIASATINVFWVRIVDFEVVVDVATALGAVVLAGEGCYTTAGVYY